MRAEAGGLPAYRSDTDSLAACLLVRDGRPDETLAELRDAFADGAW